MNQDKIGTFLQSLRKEEKLTQKEVAEKLNIHETVVSKWERAVSIPDVYYLKELSKIYHVSEHEILNGERDFKARKKSNIKVLEVVNLSKSFGKKKILDNINLDIYEGEIVGIIGPNGAGKTTLIKTILNLYKADHGSVKICNYLTTKNLEEALSKTGSVIENPDMYLNITGRANLKITALINQIKDTDYINDIIKFVGLKDRIDDKVKKYSLGMKQRLGLADALIKRPKLLILDEPTNGLDPYGIKELRDILKNISEKEHMSILISSHNLPEIENICDRVIIINEGKILSNFGIEEVKYKHITLEDEFFNKTKNIRGEMDENN